MNFYSCTECHWHGDDEDVEYATESQIICPDCGSELNNLSESRDILSEHWFNKADEAHKRKGGE